MRIQSKAKLAVQSVGRENACEQVSIGVSFASDWLREWRKFFGPITERSKGNQRHSGLLSTLK